MQYNLNLQKKVTYLYIYEEVHIQTAKVHKKQSTYFKNKKIIILKF